MTVHSLLVTGSDENLVKFHTLVLFALNSIDRRIQTVRYTCFDESLSLAVEAAKAAGVTLQKIERKGTVETYPVLVRGEMLGWLPSVTVKLDGCTARATITKEMKRRYRCKLAQNLDSPGGLFIAGETISVPKQSVEF